MRRVSPMKLHTLKSRRKRDDLIETFKILHDVYNFPGLQNVFARNTNPHRRGQSLKLYKQFAHTQGRYNFLSVLVVHNWNQLLEQIIQATSTNSFENLLDDYLA